MIELSTEQGTETCVVSLAGTLEDRDMAERAAMLVGVQHSPGQPLVVDLSGLDDTDFDPIAWFVLRLEASPGWREIRLVDHRETMRRVLRSMVRRLPVLPVRPGDVSANTSPASPPASTPPISLPTSFRLSV